MTLPLAGIRQRDISGTEYRSVLETCGWASRVSERAHRNMIGRLQCYLEGGSFRARYFKFPVSSHLPTVPPMLLFPRNPCHRDLDHLSWLSSCLSVLVLNPSARPQTIRECCSSLGIFDHNARLLYRLGIGPRTAILRTMQPKIRE
jgi:hypothetical protein